MVLHQGDLFTDEFLNVLEQGLLPEIAEGDGLAPPARPAGSADAVDVGLGHLGQVVVEYVGQLLDIQSPGGDVGGHQTADVSRLEVSQGLLAGGLALVAVDGGGGDARLAQVPGHLVGSVLGAGEDQGVFRPLPLHEMGQERGLVPLVHQIDRLADHLHRGGDGVYRHLDGIFQQGIYQLADLRGHGGGEKQGLLLLGQPLEDFPHVVDKAHVQHPVGLVQHENLQGTQGDKTLVVEVHQPPRGGHQDVNPLFQGLHLGVLAHPAEDDGVARLQVFAISVKALADLDGQFPGGGEDQSPDGPFGASDGLQPLQNRCGEGAGLACARLGAAQHVPPGQGGGDGLLLDGRGFFITLLLQGLQDGGVQPQVFKLHEILPSFYSPRTDSRSGPRSFPVGWGRCRSVSHSRSRTIRAVRASS